MPMDILVLLALQKAVDYIYTGLKKVQTVWRRVIFNCCFECQ